MMDHLKESDGDLRSAAISAEVERKNLGLDGLVGGLQAVIINTEPEVQKGAVEELLRYTGLDFSSAFRDSHGITCILRVPGGPEFRSADFLITTRAKGRSPSGKINIAPKTRQLPQTRLETFVFETSDIDRYYAIQRSRGVDFLTEIVDNENYSFVQTAPSPFTGNSVGLLQWRSRRGDYFTSSAMPLDWRMQKPDLDYLKNIRWLDHAATRVKAQDRDRAIIEFMMLTNYWFDFAIFVKSLNSITSVARLSSRDFAMVFTSGIAPYLSDEASGPTEKFIHNYGTRVHHIAFQTEKIEETYQAIREDGMKFLIELVGSPEDGLKQTFTEPSKNTLLVNEYIHRYGDFDGFFTKSNVSLLTAATGKQ
jgi:hypothetical protein